MIKHIIYIIYDLFNIICIYMQYNMMVKFQSINLFEVEPLK